MPRLSVWLIRTALAHLASGFTWGMLLLFHKGVPLSPLIWRLLPLHVECVLVGWTVQLAMGVAFWILPRVDGSRGNETLVWLAYGLLNAGVLAAGLGGAAATVPALVLLGRMAELGAVALFASQAWPRVRVGGTPKRA